MLPLAAQQATDPLSLLTGLGFPGIVIALLILGKLRTESEVKRLEAENTRKDQIIASKDAQIIQLQASITDRVIPIMTRSQQVLEHLAERNSR